MDHSDDDPFGWYSGMKSLRSMPGFSERSFPESTSEAWGSHVTQVTRRDAPRYEKVALLGQGGMGQVWLGWDVMLERHVAIKEPYEAGKLMLRREAMLMAQLEHPGIVKIHDIYQYDNDDLFVMQLVPGAPLGELLVRRSRPLDAESITRHVRHILQACEALAHAHARQILHGDLSPRNIMVAPSGATHVIDWGLARPIETSAEDSTVELAMPQGTPGFLAPEQLTGHTITLATDVWSLGALLYTILEGHPPPHATPVTFCEETRAKHRALAAITARCLAIDPGARYANAQTLAEELEAWFEGRRLHAYSPSLRELTAHTLRAHKTLAITSALFTLALLTTITIGVVQTGREAARAQHAERQAQREAATARQLLIEAHIEQARSALGQRDTYQAMAFIERGLSVGDHPELRGLLMKLLAISVPERISRTPLPGCDGRWIVTDPGDGALCLGPGARATLYRDAEELWRYEPLFDIAEHLAPAHYPDSARLRELLSDNPFEPHSPAFQWRFLDARSDSEYIYLIDNQRFLHRLDARTGRLTEIDTRIGEFISTEDHERMDWGEHRRLNDSLAPSPCLASQRAFMGRRSRKHPHSTCYLCGDGALYRSALDEEMATQLAPAGAGFDLFMEHSREDAIIVSNRAGAIWKLGEERSPLFAPSAPGRMIELSGTPYVLVQGIEGDIKAFDHRTMRWSVSLPADATSLYVGEEGRVSLIRGDVLEEWAFERQPHVERYRGMNGFSSLSWSEDGSTLGAVDGGGDAHVIDPVGGRASSPESLGTHVAKMIVPAPGTSGFYVGAIDMPHVHALHVEDAELGVEVSRGPQIETSARRIGALRDGSVYVIPYSTNIQISSPDRTTPRILTSKQPFVDLSMTPAQDALMMVSPADVWRFDHTRPGTPEVIEAALPESVMGVALRADHSFVIMHERGLTYHDARGELISRRELEELALDAQWHPEHPWLLVTFIDGSMEVYEEHDKTLELMARVRAHRARASGVSVHPGGRWAATASWDASVELYDLEPLMSSREELVRRLGDLL